MRWEWIAIGYFAYLATVAFASERFVRARWPTLAATLAMVALFFSGASDGLEAWFSPVGHALVPAPILLVGYWLSGLFFVRPMPRAERWLMQADEWLLDRTSLFAAYRAAPRLVHEYLELAYAVVYAVVPAGAVTLVLGGHADAVPRFWVIVLLAEFACFAALPWMQTRPPRALEATTAARQPRVRSLVRRFNLALLKNASIQVNTVPSGHAAGAVAVSLAVAPFMPLAGAIFLGLAASIVAATVFGRYHYAVDSMLGVLVALGAWQLVGAF